MPSCQISLCLGLLTELALASAGGPAPTASLSPPVSASRGEGESGQSRLEPGAEALRPPPAPIGLSMEGVAEVPVQRKVDSRQGPRAGLGPAPSPGGPRAPLAASEPPTEPADPRADRPPFTRFALGLGAIARTNFLPCTRYPDYLLPDECSFSPVIRTTWEIGRPRSIAFLFELETRPIPHFAEAINLALEAVGTAAGPSVGGDVVRGAITAGAGVAYGRFDIRLTVTPILDRRGHRHGFELIVGGTPAYATFSLAYKFVPGLRKFRSHFRKTRRKRGKGDLPWWPPAGS